MNATGTVTKRKKINAVIQGECGNPYLLIKLLLLQRFFSLGSVNTA